jgi:DUF438 domain-containing protein
VRDRLDLLLETKNNYIEGGIRMEQLEIMEGILNSYPYPIVFVDKDFVIRYMNQCAQYHYYQERGYKDLIGKSIFECHDSEMAKEKIKKGFESICRNGKPIFVGVNIKNLRIYMQGVKNQAGEWIGFFERFELNLQK